MWQDGGDGQDVGFDIVGGKENPQFPGDNALFVSHVTKGGAAEGKLRCVTDMHAHAVCVCVCVCLCL